MLTYALLCVPGVVAGVILVVARVCGERAVRKAARHG